jgi:primosomal protein N' (replication factor Y)
VGAGRKTKADDVTGRLWVEKGEGRIGLIAEVAPTIHVHRTYSYAVPDELANQVSVGRQVIVPIGRRGRPVTGFVVAIDRGTWDSTLRPLQNLAGGAEGLAPELVALGQELSAHYGSRLGTTLKAMAPEAVRRERGLKTVRWVRLTGRNESDSVTDRPPGAKARSVLEALQAAQGSMPVRELLAQCKVSASVIHTLVRKGRIEVVARKMPAEMDIRAGSPVEPSFSLTAEQRQAVENLSGRIDRREFAAVLLFGVSGSGKTEVYIHAIQHVLKAGRQAILLVPEIMLTTQLLQRISSRLPRVAVSHSGLSESQRAVLWRRAAAGVDQVIVGTRSAVFAPCPDLGLIIVDEEQEGSYKNLREPRFHVRDAAWMRARRRNIPLILGSATPSLETWHRSQRDPSVGTIVLRHRVLELPMPTVHVVDMRDECLEKGENVVLSRVLIRLLSESLDRNEQAMILMNRRGFAHRVYCPGCNTRLSCPNCNVGLVMHSASGTSLCHYCRTRMPTPTVCPNSTCGSKLVHHGAGTQKVEELLRGRFPKARMQRVDSDTMKHRDQYQSIIDQFADRRLDVLIGTQMIAKGLDFPAVSFVGIVDAEATGLAADFRAHERLFQLVTQTAGRAGRADTPGRVVVQTMSPHLPALRYALRHDYESFASQELGLREGIGWPPVRQLARIVLSHTREEQVRQAAESLCVQVRTLIGEKEFGAVEILGPQPCVLSRLRGRYRYDLLLRASQAAILQSLVQRLNDARLLRCKGGSIMLDVDPVSLV